MAVGRSKRRPDIELAGRYHATWPRLPILERRGGGRGSQRKGAQGPEKANEG